MNPLITIDSNINYDIDTMTKLKQNLPQINKKDDESLTKPAGNKGSSTNSHKISTAKQSRVFGGIGCHEYVCGFFVRYFVKNKVRQVTIAQETIKGDSNWSLKQIGRVIRQIEREHFILSSGGKKRRVGNSVKSDIKTYHVTAKLLDAYRKSYDYRKSTYKKEKCPTNNINNKNNTIQKASLVILDPKKELEEFVLTHEEFIEISKTVNISLQNAYYHFPRFKKIYNIRNVYKSLTEHFLKYLRDSIKNGWIKTRDYWQKHYFSTVLEKFDFSWDEKQKLVSEGIMQLDTEVAKIKDFIKERGLKYTSKKIKDAVLSILRNKNWKGIERHVEIQHQSYVSYGIIDKWLEGLKGNIPSKKMPELSQEAKEEVWRISDEIEQRRLERLRNEDEERRKALQQLKELEASRPMYPGFCL